MSFCNLATFPCAGSSNTDINSKLQVSNAAIIGAIVKEELFKLNADEVSLNINRCLSQIKGLVLNF